VSVPVAFRRRVHYAWVVFAVTWVVLLLAAGMRAAPGVLIGPLHDAFGWTKADVGLAVSVNVLLYGFMGPFAAALLARYGLRRVVPCALALVATGSYLASTVHAVWQLVLYWGVFVGLGTGCMAAVLAASVANRWFVARRGLVTGALMAAGASGQVGFFQILTRLTEDGSWTRVPKVVAAGAVLAIVPAALFLRDKPEDVGQRAYGAPPGHRTPGPVPNPVRTALRGLRAVSASGAFWVLWGSFFVCGMSTNGLIQTHFLEAAHDHQIARTAAATLISLIGLFDIVGTIASGWLTDRYDPRRLLLVYYGLRGASLLLLQPALASGRAPLALFIGFYGLDWVATVPPTVALCRELCGPELATVAYGWVFAGHQVGASLAAWGAGWLRDATGTYQPAFLLAAVACFVAAFGVLRVRGSIDAVPSPGGGLATST
jgi:MFS family permease